MKSLAVLLLAATSVAASTFWQELIPRHGVAPFNNDTSSYKVFRNVKTDFGAVGDGVTDDTAAINLAISSGNRCGPQCNSSTTTPAVVYFPAGTYLISSNIYGYYDTQIIGDATNFPVIKASADFKNSEAGNGMLDADPYVPNGWGARNTMSVNNFYLQVRNIVFDLRSTNTPGVIGVHWPVAQATSIQNCQFLMQDGPQSTQQGIWIEDGSGGLMSDLYFQGGQWALNIGNQQFTMRNITITGAQAAINQNWDWGWTYKSLSISNCSVGINMSTSDVGSVTLLDSNFTSVDTAILTGRDPRNETGQGSLVIENVLFTNVPTVLAGPRGAAILGGHKDGTVKDQGIVMGNTFTPLGGSATFQGSENSTSSNYPRPQALLSPVGGQFYERSKPSYASTSLHYIAQARNYSAKGDGKTDDTKALNNLLEYAATASSFYANNGFVFLDAGFYLVTDTIYVPPNVRIVGEGLASVIMASGPKFSKMNKPYPVVQIGKAGEKGTVEISDLFVSTQGPAAGAVLIEYNLNTPAGMSSCSAGGQPSGLWDVHTRIGGFAGSQLQIAQCVKTPSQVDSDGSLVPPSCIAAHTSMHITKSAGNLLMENNWFWVADHDIEDPTNTQISVYAGRGLLLESTSGTFWLYSTAVEHHTLYQYQLVNTQNIFLGQIQTETPYYQPNPPAPYPFTLNASLFDPDFSDCASANNISTPLLGNGTSSGGTAACAMAWGLRVLGSHDIVVFGAGLYSFFNNYDVSCSTRKAGEDCQARMFWVGNAPSASAGAVGSDVGNGTGTISNLAVYNLNTVGAVNMVTQNGVDVVNWQKNFATFASSLAMYVFGA